MKHINTRRKLVLVSVMTLILLVIFYICELYLIWIRASDFVGTTVSHTKCRLMETKRT